MAYEYESNLRAGETAGEGLGDRDRGTTGVEKCRSVEHSFTALPDRHHHRSERRAFLVACHQASISIETISRYLGLDVETIRDELLRGIEAWNAAQRRTRRRKPTQKLRCISHLDRNLFSSRWAQR